MAVTPSREEGAPVRQMTEHKDKDEQALRRGADREQNFRGRGMFAHEDRAQRVCGDEREGGAEKGRRAMDVSPARCSL